MAFTYQTAFRLSLISMAFLSQFSMAEEFVNYTGPNSNPVRTREEVLDLQNRYKSNELGLEKDHYRYPAESYYSVAYLAGVGLPSETIIDLSFHLERKRPNKLLIENYNFTLDKSFPIGNVLDIGKSEVKFRNSTIALGSVVSTLKDVDMYFNEVFYARDAKLTLENINIRSLNPNSDIALGTLVNNSTLALNNVTVDLQGDLFVGGIEMSDSKATVDKLNLTIKSDKSAAFFVEKSDFLLKNSIINLSSNKNDNSTVFAVVDSDVEIVDSKIEAKGHSIGLINEINTLLEDEKLSRPVTNITLRNSHFLSEDRLIYLDSQFSLFKEEDGSDKNYIYSPLYNVNTFNSTLAGSIVENNNEKIKLTLNLAENSKWKMTGDSNFNKLTIQDSDIQIEKGDFHTLTLTDLSGKGQFGLRTDLANQKSDQIIIKGTADGQHTLAVKDSGNEPQSANGKVTLVKTAGNGEAVFALKDRDYVDAGAYRYRLGKEGNDWVLSNKSAELVDKPVEPAKPAETVKPAEPAKPAETVKPVEPAKPAETVKPVEPAKPAETVKPVEPAKPAETVKPVEPTKPAETVKPSEPTKPLTPTEVKPVEPTKPIDIVKPTEPTVVPPIVPTQPTIQNEQVVLSEKSNALVSLHQAQLLQLEQGLAGIHQRLGELKQTTSGNIWVRNLNARNEFGATHTASNSQSSGFEQDYHGIQIGADKAISDQLRLGGFVGSARSSVDFNGEYGSGKLTDQSVGIYATYQTESGLYMDNIAQFSRLKSRSTATGERRYQAYTLSSEVGKRYDFANQWAVTPNAQLAWQTLSGKGDEDRLSSIYARLGVRLAKQIDVGQWKIQPYAEVNSIIAKNRQANVRVNQHQFDVKSSRGRIATALGVNINQGNHRFGLEAKTTQGKHLDQPVVIQANYRYQW